MFNVEEIRKKLVSLDIETSGLQDDAKIWSIGISGTGSGVSYENFSDPRSDKNMSLLEYFRSTSGNFADEQFNRGSFNELQDRINSSRVFSENSLVSDSLLRLNNNAILIQNANFENNKIGRVLDENNLDFSSSFRYRTVDSRSNKILYTPPKITTMRNSAAYMRANGAELTDVLPIYENMLSEYGKEFKNNDKNIVVELMDFSRAIFAKAANAGLLNRKNFDGNLSVSFLSKEMLGEEEVHTALSDSIQQESIFFKLIGINSEIDSGSISKETKDMFFGMNLKLKAATREKFRRELENITGEIDRNGKTRLIAASLLKSINVRVSGPDGTETISVPKYRDAAYTSSKDEAIAHTVNRYSHVLDNTSMKNDVETFIDSTLKDFPVTKSIFDKSDSKTIDASKKTGNIGRNLLIAGAAIAGISYLSGKVMESRSKNKKRTKKEGIIPENLFPLQDKQRHNYM